MQESDGVELTPAEAGRQTVVFSLHGEHYGLPITAVREIIRYVPPSATATARGEIQGMISLRGRTLPIVDLSSRLGQQLEVGVKTRILVLEVAGGALGLVVDNVDGILPIPAERIEPLPLSAAGDGLGEEVAAVGDRLIVLIDPERSHRSGRVRRRGADDPWAQGAGAGRGRGGRSSEPERRREDRHGRSRAARDEFAPASRS